MKKNLLYIFAVAATLFTTACSGDDDDNTPKPPATPPATGKVWTLVWAEEFNNESLNTNVWSKIPEGSPDWQKYQSSDTRCYDFRDGYLVLRGIVNDDLLSDSRPYLCGGVWTKGKKEIKAGSKVEVRARMAKGSQGAWPAIWMMPWNPVGGWPACGEIDIMERINHEQAVYQTVHSSWVDSQGHGSDPMYSTHPSVDVTKFHTYSATILADKVIFAIDGITQLEYPKTQDNLIQYPYFQSWELRLDMQLGGSWVGNVLTSQLPVEMEIDWVHVYE